MSQHKARIDKKNKGNMLEGLVLVALSVSFSLCTTKKRTEVQKRLKIMLKTHFIFSGGKNVQIWSFFSVLLYLETQAKCQSLIFQFSFFVCVQFTKVKNVTKEFCFTFFSVPVFPVCKNKVYYDKFLIK